MSVSLIEENSSFVDSNNICDISQNTDSSEYKISYTKRLQKENEDLKEQNRLLVLEIDKMKEMENRQTHLSDLLRYYRSSFYELYKQSFQSYKFSQTVENENNQELKEDVNKIYSYLKTMIIPPIIHSSKTFELINQPIKDKLPIRRDISISDNDYVEQFGIVNEMLNSLSFNNNKNNNKEISKEIKNYLNEYNMVLSNMLDSVSSYIQYQQDELNIMKENYDKLLIKSIVDQDKINVYIRCRKPEDDEDNELKIVEINNENEKEIVMYGTTDTFKYYEFDNCFNENSSQIDIYNELNYVIPSLLDGYYISIISYGIKGSGKSYTLFGETDKVTDRKLMKNGKINVDSDIGLSYRIIIDIYNYILFNNYDSEMKISVVELRNDEEVYDILHWYNSEEKGNEDFKLNIRYSNKTVEFSDINDVLINDKKDIIKILNICKEKRKRKDDIPSSMFIYVTLKIKTVNKVLESKLTIVDMIDSDRKITKSEIKIKEKSEYLYPSISSFSNIINHLVENRVMINYKENKLTLLLRDSFNGKSKTVMLCNINTTLKYSDEISNTLSFAYSLKNIQYGTKVNNFIQYSNQINEIRRLKKTIEDIKNGNGMNEERDNEILMLKATVDDLKEQLELYKEKDEEIIGLIKENNQLNDKLIEFENNKLEILRLKEEINELQKKNVEIIKEKDEEINQLTIQNEILNKTIESDKDTESKLKERILHQHEQLNKSIANTNELKKMVEIQNQSLIEMKLITETLQRKMKEMEIELENEKEIVKEKDDRIRMLEESIPEPPVIIDSQTQTLPQPQVQYQTPNRNMQMRKPPHTQKQLVINQQPLQRQPQQKQERNQPNPQTIQKQSQSQSTKQPVVNQQQHSNQQRQMPVRNIPPPPQIQPQRQSTPQVRNQPNSQSHQTPQKTPIRNPQPHTRNQTQVQQPQEQPVRRNTIQPPQQTPIRNPSQSQIQIQPKPKPIAQQRQIQPQQTRSQPQIQQPVRNQQMRSIPRVQPQAQLNTQSQAQLQTRNTPQIRQTPPPQQHIRNQSQISPPSQVKRIKQPSPQSQQPFRNYFTQNNNSY